VCGGQYDDRRPFLEGVCGECLRVVVGAEVAHRDVFQKVLGAERLGWHAGAGAIRFPYPTAAFLHHVRVAGVAVLRLPGEGQHAAGPERREVVQSGAFRVC
jgi:hypothetical protein